MDAAAGEAAYADAQKSSDKQDLDPEAFEDDGKDEFKGMEKKEKKKAKKSKREKEEAKHAGGVLGMFAVKRVCLRGHRYDIDAFMRKTKTTEKDVTSNIIKLESARSKKFRNQRRAFLACADNDDDRWLIYLKRAREGEPEAVAYLATLDAAHREWDPEWAPSLTEQEEWFKFAKKKKQRCSWLRVRNLNNPTYTTSPLRPQPPPSPHCPRQAKTPPKAAVSQRARRTGPAGCRSGPSRRRRTRPACRRTRGAAAS